MDKVTNGLNKLNAVLPLKDRQDKVDPQIRDAHKSVLTSFVEKGAILTKSELAQIVDDVDQAISILKDNDMVVFDDNNEPIGSYPFTMQEREHKISVNGHNVHAMCALDSLGVSPMFGYEVEINSQCRVTGDAVKIKQKDLEVLNAEENKDVQFGIIWAAADSSCSCCANSLCMEMMFLKDSAVAEKWLAEDSANREVYTLPEAIDFSARFFAPLIKG
jgi:Alkylmercury lyase